MSIMLKQDFQDFIFSTNTERSGKAASYIRALDMLGPILMRHYPHPEIINGSMWHSFDLADINAIRNWILAEKKKGDASVILAEFKSPSYLKNDFCSAAVRAFGEFMAITHFEDSILKHAYDETSGKVLAQKMEKLIAQNSNTDLEKHLHFMTTEGKTKLAVVTVRINQDIFRKMVLANYGCKCCITGLTIPEVLRASHISAWAEDEVNRLNPENGLCLSATYDAAFDRHLISFDDDYRMIVSKDIKDFYTDAVAKSYFLDHEGQKIFLPNKFLPSKSLLSKHRELIVS